MLFYIIAGFLSDRVQTVVVDSIRSENVWVVSGVPQGSVLGSFLFLLHTGDLPITREYDCGLCRRLYFVGRSTRAR